LTVIEAAALIPIAFFYLAISRLAQAAGARTPA
jgi:hypothetical protein